MANGIFIKKPFCGNCLAQKSNPSKKSLELEAKGGKNYEQKNARCTFLFDSNHNGQWLLSVLLSSHLSIWGISMASLSLTTLPWMSSVSVVSLVLTRQARDSFEPAVFFWENQKFLRKIKGIFLKNSPSAKTVGYLIFRQVYFFPKNPSHEKTFFHALLNLGAIHLPSLPASKDLAY